MIISIGYRVKSPKGILFRRWANTVLKEYLIKGVALNQRIASLESRMEDKFAQYDHKLYEHSKKIDFFIQSSLPPKQGIFFDGQIYDAYAFVSDLVRKAARRIVLIDNYIDDTVLTMLSKRTADAVYLVGASIKDLGKKWFGFTLMENTEAEEIIGKIELH